MRVTAKGFGSIAAIAMATAFAGCECSMQAGSPPATPAAPAQPAPPAAPAAPAPGTPQAASSAHPPALAPLPASMRAKLEGHDGGT